MFKVREDTQARGGGPCGSPNPSVTPSVVLYFYVQCLCIFAPSFTPQASLQRGGGISVVIFVDYFLGFWTSNATKGVKVSKPNQTNISWQVGACQTIFWSNPVFQSVQKNPRPATCKVKPKGGMVPPTMCDMGGGGTKHVRMCQEMC